MCCSILTINNAVIEWVPRAKLKKIDLVLNNLFNKNILGFILLLIQLGIGAFVVKLFLKQKSLRN